MMEPKTKAIPSACVDRDVMAALVQDVKRKAQRSDVTHAAMNECLKDPKALAMFASRMVDHQIKTHTAGWQVILSLDVYACGTKSWHGSAMLWPQGRCSTQEDWQNLGTIVSLTGGPPSTREQLQHQLETIHPNRPHHWWWQEQGEENEEGED